MRVRRRRSSNRRRRRRRRRNAWKGQKRQHRLAALKGWRKRKRGGRRRRKARNRGRRVRRRLRRRVGWNRRRRRRRRRRARNTGKVASLRRPVAALTSAFNPKLLTRAGTVVGGALGNAYLSGMVSSYMPGILASGPGNYLVGLGTAGLMGAALGSLRATRGIAGDVFFGGVIEVATRAIKEYIVPLIPGMSGLGDYLSVDNAAAARPLGDYLTPMNAASARPLGSYYGGDQYISEELAGL